MASLLALAGWVLAALALAGLALGLALLLFPEMQRRPMAFIEQHLFPDANQIMLKNSKAFSTEGGRSVYRVLAFGDSLTEGFTQGGVDFHPYITRLGDVLYPKLPKGWHLEVEEQGESGERVLMGMKHRLQRALDEHDAAGRPYDWVLLLGGINDLGGDASSADEVMGGLKVLVEACLQHGANVLLMTVMEVAEVQEGVEQQRLQLNRLIKQYAQDGTQWAGAAANATRMSAGNAQAQPAASKAAAGGTNSSSSSSKTPVQRRGAPRVELFDLASSLTWTGMTQEQRWEYWDDGVHLSRDGYDLMGGLIAEALTPLVQRELVRASAAADVGAADVVAWPVPTGAAAKSNGAGAGAGVGDKKLH